MSKSRTKQDAADNPASAMTAAMMIANPAAAKAWTEVMTECGRFMMDRLQKDLETQKAMMSCTNPADLLKVQTEFYQQAAQQYSEEATRLFQMMTSATTETVKEAKFGHSRKYDDVPL